MKHFKPRPPGSPLPPVTERTQRPPSPPLVHIPPSLHDRPHAVYRLLDATGAVLYVGMTSRATEEVILRLNNRKPWRDEVARVELDMFPDMMTATAEMKRLIAAKPKPRYNTAPRPPKLTKEEKRERRASKWGSDVDWFY